ncbi:hypothetical protein PMI01_04113 [Caulobacter sp. AP07]|uniref:DUF6491 family protein n=1 Tax=Caulobacter sp. AP07 TaxID=1144304 RepID=UPI000271E418|nr:DUF6491 family protein [Caulobacter sp. AP07]EJL26306.1 hypothetical protein PMI01_04113 [Caulobacter sp. AP07]
MNRIGAVVLAATFLAATGGLPVTASDAKGPDARVKPAKQCFRSGRIANWAVSGDSVINVRLQTAAVYQVTLVGACPGLGTYRTLAFDTSFNDEICDGRPATVITRSGAGPLRCAVKSVRQLAPEEAAALPDAQRP